MNGTSPIVTNTLSTIPAKEAAPQAAPETPDKTAPPVPGESGAASDAAAQDEGEDKNLELAKKFEAIATKESRARKVEREAQQRLATLTEKEKALEAKLAELDEALGDPVGYMLKQGKDPVAVAKRYAEPETEAEKRIRKLEDALQKREEEDARKAKEWEERQESDRKFQSLRGFVSEITSQNSPNLTALYEAREVPRLVEDLLNRPADPAEPEGPTMLEAFRAKYRDARGNPRNPTNKEIRDCLEYEAELRATKILERHRAKAPDASVAQPHDPAQSQDSPKGGAGPSGISNQHAAGRSSGKSKPPTLEERRKKMREELTAALDAEAADD